MALVGMRPGWNNRLLFCWICRPAPQTQAPGGYDYLEPGAARPRTNGFERMTVLSQDVVADLRRENAALQAELRAARDRQDASAEILRTIGSVSGDAARSLQQIAETSARLFGAPSVSIQLVQNGEWAEAYRFGDSAQRIRSAVPLANIRVGGQNMPGAVVGQNRQIHIPDLDNLDPALADWPGLAPKALLDNRDLKPTLDLRSVFKGVLEEHMRIDAHTLDNRVFPDSQGTHPLQGLIRA